MDCCKINNKTNKSCIRKQDNKLFTLPRLFKKSDCLDKKIKGFTKRASCAPYKYCKKPSTQKKSKKQKGGKNNRNNKNNKYRNMNNESLEICSTKPMTGFYRDGYCKTGSLDLGTHTVCAKVDQDFLDYTAKQGNDLSSVVKDGENWCLCEHRWNQAYKAGFAPKVIMSATNFKTSKNIKNNIRHFSKKNNIRHFSKKNKKNKKNKY